MSINCMISSSIRNTTYWLINNAFLPKHYCLKFIMQWLSKSNNSALFDSIAQIHNNGRGYGTEQTYKH